MSVNETIFRFSKLLLSFLTVLEQCDEFDSLFQFELNPAHSKVYRQFPYANRMWQATLRYTPVDNGIDIRIQLPNNGIGEPYDRQEFIGLILNQIAFRLFSRFIFKIANDADIVRIKDVTSGNSITLSFEHCVPIDWEPGTGTTYSDSDILKKFKKYLSPASISKASAAERLALADSAGGS